MKNDLNSFQHSHLKNYKIYRNNKQALLNEQNLIVDLVSTYTPAFHETMGWTPLTLKTHYFV